MQYVHVIYFSWQIANGVMVAIQTANQNPEPIYLRITVDCMVKPMSIPNSGFCTTHITFNETG